MLICMSLVVVVPQVMTLHWIGLPRSDFRYHQPGRNNMNDLGLAAGAFYTTWRRKEKPKLTEALAC